MRGCTFGEWEDQADEFDRTLTAAFLEELAMLDEAALAQHADRCPHCSSTRVYLDQRGDQGDRRVHAASVQRVRRTIRNCW